MINRYREFDRTRYRVVIGEKVAIIGVWSPLTES
jgi:hypothetical protein